MAGKKTGKKTDKRRRENMTLAEWEKANVGRVPDIQFPARKIQVFNPGAGDGEDLYDDELQGELDGERAIASATLTRRVTSPMPVLSARSRNRDSPDLDYSPDLEILELAPPSPVLSIVTAAEMAAAEAEVYAPPSPVLSIMTAAAYEAAYEDDEQYTLGSVGGALNAWEDDDDDITFDDDEDDDILGVPVPVPSASEGQIVAFTQQQKAPKPTAKANIFRPAQGGSGKRFKRSSPDDKPGWRGGGARVKRGHKTKFLAWNDW